MKKFMSLLLVLAMVFSLGACGDSKTTAESKKEVTTDENSENTSDADSTTDQNSSEVEDSYYPITIQTYNHEGEQIEVIFDKEPERVICCCQNNIEVMLRLGLVDKVVAACGLDGPVSEDLTDEFAKMKYFETNLSKEETVALEPDCILAWYSKFSEKRLGDVAYWNENGCGTYMSLDSGCRRNQEGYTQTVEDEMQDILNIGKIFNVEDKAQAIVDDVYAEIAKIEEYTAEHTKVGIAILEDEKDSYRVYGSNVIGGDIAKRAGAVLTVGAESSKNITGEELIEKDPEAIFMIYFYGYLEPEDAIKAITENPKYASLQAVKNNKVFALNLTNAYCSGCRCKDGVLTIAENIYPDLYK